MTTDLPRGTRVAVDATRCFREPDGSEIYWQTIDESYPVTMGEGSINHITLRMTALDLDTKGLHMHRSLKGRWPLEMASPPFDELTVMVHAPATAHRFGLCNRRLTGSAVTVHASGHYLERLATIAVPFAPEIRAALGF